MLCERVLGNLNDAAFAEGLGPHAVDWVDFEWHELFKRVHRKTSAGGRDVGVRLSDAEAARGLADGDVLGVDGAGAGGGPGAATVVVAVRLLPTECLVIDVAPDHARALAQAAWEVGNTHAPLFYDAGGPREGGLRLLCEYSAPLERLLRGIDGVDVAAGRAVLDPARRLAAGGHAHGHAHAHAHAHGD